MQDNDFACNLCDGPRYVVLRACVGDVIELIKNWFILFATVLQDL